MVQGEPATLLYARMGLCRILSHHRLQTCEQLAVGRFTRERSRGLCFRTEALYSLHQPELQFDDLS